MQQVVSTCTLRPRAQRSCQAQQVANAERCCAGTSVGLLFGSAVARLTEPTARRSVSRYPRVAAYGLRFSFDVRVSSLSTSMYGVTTLTGVDCRGSEGDSCKWLHSASPHATHSEGRSLTGLTDSMARSGACPYSLLDIARLALVRVTPSSDFCFILLPYVFTLRTFSLHAAHALARSILRTSHRPYP